MNTLAVKFLLPIFLVLTLFALLINHQVASSVRQTLLQQASGQVAGIVQLQASRNHVTVADFSQAGETQSSTAFNNIYQEVHTKEVIRFKVWNPGETIVFSDDKSLINKNFGDNDELKDALDTGQVQTEITKPGAAENVDERNFPEFMEIYTPITPAGSSKPAGVIETYYQLNGLEQQLQKFRTNSATLILVSYAVLATLLVFILVITVIGPIQRLQKATARIREGDLDTPVDIKSNDELGKLGKNFNEMLKGLKDLERLKNEFVFVAAHELRAPVTVIKGYLSMYKTEADTQADAIEQISQANSRLEQLVEDLLEIARADAGKLTVSLTPIDLCKMIGDNVKFFAPLAQQKSMTVEYKSPDAKYEIMADEKRLKEVITNLMSNAIKYGSEHGYVRIYHELKDDSVITTIEDNGQGISAEGQKHMFEKFYRTPEAQSSKIVGTGLGLYITKELVERMGGKIWFESALGRGTKFFIEFKLTSPPVDTPPPA